MDITKKEYETFMFFKTTKIGIVITGNDLRGSYYINKNGLRLDKSFLKEKYDNYLDTEIIKSLIKKQLLEPNFIEEQLGYFSKNIELSEPKKKKLDLTFASKNGIGDYACIKSIRGYTVIKLKSWFDWEWDDFSTIKYKDEIIWFKSFVDGSKFLLNNFEIDEIDDKIVFPYKLLKKGLETQNLKLSNKYTDESGWYCLILYKNKYHVKDFEGIDKWKWEDYIIFKQKGEIVWFNTTEDAIKYMKKNFNEQYIDEEY